MNSFGVKRREFIGAAALVVAAPAAWARAARAILGPDATTRFGLVTYLWGKDLQLEDLISLCESTGLEGVELRTTHAHGVEPQLDGKGRALVRSKFENSNVELLGIGSNERFDSPDRATLARAIMATEQFLRLSADIGGSGVKVKPDSFHSEVEPEITIEQIGRTLGTLGPRAADLGQEIRLEVHGGCSDPEVIARIIEIADHPAVKACWNCNARDLRGVGFQKNFQRLRPHFGGTLHCRRLDQGDYPSIDLLRLLQKSSYQGVVLLEAHSEPPRQRISALRNQREIFDRHTAAVPAASSSEDRITIAPQEGNPELIDVKHEDAPFLTCRIGDENPSLYPLYASGDRLVVRAFPFEQRAGEAKDHPHHRSCWFAHGDVDGHDFWHDKDCQIRVQAHEIDGNAIRWSADWIAPDGEKIATEDRTMRFSGKGDTRKIEFDFTLTPESESMRFGDTKEGTFAIRVAPTIRLKGEKARGRIENSQGQLDGACWGSRSPWVLYEGPIDSRLVRIRMTDHPDNPRHPTWWHARDYGLFAANPFGRSDFERGSAKMPMVVTKTNPLRLRYTLDVETGIS